MNTSKYVYSGKLSFTPESGMIGEYYNYTRLLGLVLGEEFYNYPHHLTVKNTHRTDGVKFIWEQPIYHDLTYRRDIRTCMELNDGTSIPLSLHHWECIANNGSLVERKYVVVLFRYNNTFIRVYLSPLHRGVEFVVRFDIDEYAMVSHLDIIEDILGALTYNGKYDSGRQTELPDGYLLDFDPSKYILI